NTMRKWANGFINGLRRADKRHIPSINLLLLSDKPFYCKIKLGSIPFAGVDPFRLLWFRQKSKTTDAQK
ncbi:hypothetical protein, partial [Bacteroides acidifaciens]|uniref:hypothetical protein n=1 Tax=Bacteroides acidifaciens TaxID=85831 RepID=UPI0025AFE735